MGGWEKNCTDFLLFDDYLVEIRETWEIGLPLSFFISNIIQTLSLYSIIIIVPQRDALNIFFEKSVFF